MFNRLFFGPALLVAVSTGSFREAQAQSWYPRECLTVDFCAAVENVNWIASAAGGSPQLFVSSRYGDALIQKEFPVQVSGDGRMHVCMRYDPFGSLEVTCLMVPNPPWP